MYFWNIESLKSGILAGGLSELDKFIYLAIYVGLGCIITESMFYFPTESTNIYDFIGSLAYIATVILGLYFCFRANGGNKGVDFCGRFVAIGFVVNMRFIVCTIPFLLLINPVSTNESSLIDTAFFIVWHIALYWRMYVHFKQVRVE